MSGNYPEKSHNNIKLDKYAGNFDQIDWRVKAPNDTPDTGVPVAEMPDANIHIGVELAEPVQECALPEMSMSVVDVFPLTEEQVRELLRYFNSEVVGVPEILIADMKDWLKRFE